MPLPALIAVLRPSTLQEARSAYLTPFGIKPRSVEEEFGVKTTQIGRCGCRVPRLSLSIHCSEPHVECASHVMESGFNYTLSQALPNGKVENCLLISPRPETLGSSGETYVAGMPHDLIISRREVAEQLSKFAAMEYDSIIIRFSPEFLPTYEGTGEIESWPYLSQECAYYIRSMFSHVRTNAPSVERADSGGGMWNHCVLFNLPEGQFSYSDYQEKRTIGELFHIPSHIADGIYQLICPYLEMQADCALVVPLLYSLS